MLHCANTTRTRHERTNERANGRVACESWSAWQKHRVRMCHHCARRSSECLEQFTHTRTTAAVTVWRCMRNMTGVNRIFRHFIKCETTGRPTDRPTDQRGFVFANGTHTHAHARSCACVCVKLFATPRLASFCARCVLLKAASAALSGEHNSGEVYA